MGIKSPWQVTGVELALSEGEVTVHVEQEEGSAQCCPACGEVSPGYDSRRRSWRHLDTCQYKTIKKHLWGILNAVILKVSNGLAEGLNSRIKMIKVRSRGFRNKERFANAIYFYLGGLDLYPEAIPDEDYPLDQGKRQQIERSCFREATILPFASKCGN